MPTSVNILWEQCLGSLLASSESGGKSELAWDTLDTVVRVDILDQGDLVAGC